MVEFTLHVMRPGYLEIKNHKVQLIFLIDYYALFLLIEFIVIVEGFENV